MSSVKRIAVLGPESSGKSELCKQLAIRYQTLWVDEYARTYLNAINRDYTLDDIVTIYSEQFRLEQELLARATKYIFVDTEFIIAKVWCMNAFQTCPGYVEEMIKIHPYDLYLLTAPDLPWEYDPLRENPGKGDFFFQWYVSLLDAYRFNYGIVYGTGSNRLHTAIQIIESHFTK